MPKKQPIGTIFQRSISHTTVKPWTKICGLYPLGGAINIRNLYLINHCTDSHQIFIMCLACHYEAMDQTWWTLYTRGRCRGRFNFFFFSAFSVPNFPPFPNGQRLETWHSLQHIPHLSYSTVVAHVCL